MSQHFQSYFSHALLKKCSLIFTQTLPTLGMLCLIEFEFVSSNYLDSCLCIFSCLSFRNGPARVLICAPFGWFVAIFIQNFHF